MTTNKKASLQEVDNESDTFEIVTPSTMAESEPLTPPKVGSTEENEPLTMQLTDSPQEPTGSVKEPSDDGSLNDDESDIDTAAKPTPLEEKLVSFLMEQNKRLIKRLPNVASISKEYTAFSNKQGEPKDAYDDARYASLPMPPMPEPYAPPGIDPYTQLPYPEPWPNSGPPFEEPPAESDARNVKSSRFCNESTDLWEAMIRLSRVIEAASGADTSASVVDDIKPDHDPFLAAVDPEDALLNSQLRFGDAIDKLERKYGLRKAKKVGKKKKGASVGDSGDKVLKKGDGTLWSHLCDLKSVDWRASFYDICNVLGLVAMIVVAFQLYVIAGNQKTRNGWW